MRITKIPKGKGRYRTIYVPSDQESQSLRGLIPIIVDLVRKHGEPGIIHGFMPGRSPVTNALQHRGYAHSFSVDLKDFFDTVTPDMLPEECPRSTRHKASDSVYTYRVPGHLVVSYERDNAIVTVKRDDDRTVSIPLCKEVVHEHGHVAWLVLNGQSYCEFTTGINPGVISAYKIGTIRIDSDTPFDLFPDGAARQGLPTSPAVCNLAAVPLDRDIVRLLDGKARYTRYADDLTFSFDDYELYGHLKDTIPDLIERHGFEVNKRKYRLQHAKAGRRIITGVGVDDDVHPTRALKRRMRAAFHKKRHRIAMGLKEAAAVKVPKGYQDDMSRGLKFWHDLWTQYGEI